MNNGMDKSFYSLGSTQVEEYDEFILRRTIKEIVKVRKMSLLSNSEIDEADLKLVSTPYGFNFELILKDKHQFSLSWEDVFNYVLWKIQNK